MNVLLNYISHCYKSYFSIKLLEINRDRMKSTQKTQNNWRSNYGKKTSPNMLPVRFKTSKISVTLKENQNNRRVGSGLFPTYRIRGNFQKQKGLKKDREEGVCLEQISNKRNYFKRNSLGTCVLLGPNSKWEKNKSREFEASSASRKIWVLYIRSACKCEDVSK